MRFTPDPILHQLKRICVRGFPGIRQEQNDVASIREGLEDRSWEVLGITFGLRFTEGPELAFKNGGIQISGRVEPETWIVFPPLPRPFVAFEQLVRLALDPSTQMVKPERVGEPVVTTRLIPNGRAVSVVRSEIDNALAANAASVEQVFADARSTLVNGLKRFDAAVSASYTVVEITPDGVIARGELGSAARRLPVVDIAETHQGAAFTAFQSWISAGRIERFVWSWVEHAGFSIWSGVEKSITDEHRFILPKPPGLTQISQICLRIEGTRIMPDGHQAGIAAGTTCQLPEPEFEIGVPSWWEPLALPIWRPDLDDRTALSDAIAGHVGVQSDAPRQEPFSRNALVYFADWRSERPLHALSAALSRVRNGSAPLVIVVLPAGAFDSSRREVESKLPASCEPLSAPVQFTEDNEGGWTRMFAVARTPSAYLITAKREFVWKHEGEPDPAALAAILDEHRVPSSAPRLRPLRLAVSAGDAAPDVSFEDDRRNQVPRGTAFATATCC